VAIILNLSLHVEALYRGLAKCADDHGGVDRDYTFMTNSTTIGRRNLCFGWQCKKPLSYAGIIQNCLTFLTFAIWACWPALAV